MLLAVKFSEFIVKVNVIIGMICAIVGVASLIVAYRFAQAVDKSETVTKSSKAYIYTRIFGVVMILLGMILIALPI